jgi:hypothetical protein
MLFILNFPSLPLILILNIYKNGNSRLYIIIYIYTIIIRSKNKDLKNIKYNNLDLII